MSARLLIHKNLCNGIAPPLSYGSVSFNQLHVCKMLDEIDNPLCDCFFSHGNLTTAVLLRHWIRLTLPQEVGLSYTDIHSIKLPPKTEEKWKQASCEGNKPDKFWAPFSPKAQLFRNTPAAFSRTPGSIGFLCDFLLPLFTEPNTRVLWYFFPVSDFYHMLMSGLHLVGSTLSFFQSRWVSLFLVDLM